MPSHVTLTELSLDLGLDRSGVRKYVLKHGFEPFAVRTPGSRGQSTLALRAEDAEAVKELRQSQGFAIGAVPGEIIDNSIGVFYIVQLIPELDPNRVKLGYATGMDGRLAAHRTAAPTATLLKTWPCRKVWEVTAIASISRIECKSLSNEVFTCDDVGRLLERADAFFALMPSA